MNDNFITKKIESFNNILIDYCRNKNLMVQYYTLRDSEYTIKYMIFDKNKYDIDTNKLYEIDFTQIRGGNIYLLLKDIINDIEKNYFAGSKKLDSLYIQATNALRNYNTKSLLSEAIFKFKIDRVIFNEPATIVIWEDGSKSVVKAEGEPYDPEKGLAMAIAKKVYGNKYNYYNVIDRWVKKYYKEKKRNE